MSELSDRISKLSPAKRALLERRMKAGEQPSRAAGHSIAVIGIGCRFPGGADSPRAFWKMLVGGCDCVREVPPERWNIDQYYDPNSTVRGKMATRWGAFLDGIEDFEPSFFDITLREALHMDPQQRLFIETAWEAVEDAGLVAADLSGSSTGVFVSAHNLSSDYYVRQWAEHADIDAYSATGGAHSIIANRLSYWLDLQGPSLVVDTACSASLVATHLAINSIASGECDLAIAGGVNLIPSPDTTIALSGLQMMAADGRCKTFDTRADGFVRGEGCGAIVLKRLPDAERDGDAIYAVIRGSAVNQDGRTNGLTAPNGLSQQKVLQRALKRAGVDGKRIGYVEAHGTGTALGDPIEVEALTEVMGRPADGIPCALGSVKTNIGHLESASGIAGLIKAILTLHNEYIAPNLHFTALNPHISLNETRFVLPTEGQPWPAEGEVRFAGVSSFGFGGTNAHIVLEEAPRESSRPAVEDMPVEERVLVLSARDPAALRASASNLSALMSAGEASYADVCFTAACRRTHHEHRVAVLAADGKEAAAALEAFVDGDSPPALIERSAPGLGAPRTAWVFSGQGSQHVGMGRGLMASEPVFRQTIEKIDETFAGLAGWSLAEEIGTADEERLSQTEFAQPAIFAIEVALAALLDHYGMRPDMVVGHSLGEVAAACIGGALSLEDAVTVIFHRGRLMQALHGAGRMATVAGPEDEVRRCLAADHAGVAVAAVNGPLAVTVSGEPAAVEKFINGVDWPARELPVEYAFHSAQMEPLKAELTAAVAAIRSREPSVRVFSTVRGSLAGGGDFGPDYWARNIREPVSFAAAIVAMAEAGATCFVELGPQAVLGPAIEQCLEKEGKPAAILGALMRNRPERLRDVLAALHVNGLPVDWARVFRGRGRAVRLPTYPWQRRRCWFDPRKDLAQAADGVPATGDLCYELAWPLRTPLQDWIGRSPFECASSLEEAAAAVAGRREEIYREHAAEDSKALVQELEDEALRYAVAALRRLGFPLRSGDRYTDEELAAAATGYRQRVLTRLFRLLEENGAIENRGGVRRVVDHDVLLEPPGDTGRPPTGAAEIFTLLRRCGEHVADVVADRCDPLSLLFPGDYRSSAEWVYADAPISRVANEMLAQAVAELAGGITGSRTLRVLEIGAGTGGSTRSVLPRLPEDRTEYVFTDLSQSFLKQAGERFAADLPIHYALLDIEVDPLAQGFAGGQFDLVIAANVVHATADLERSLRHARDLLAPGGVLLLLEGTARRGWIDLTFGLTEGWWRFTDTDLRIDHPLLDAGAWQRLLADCGFRDATAIAVERDPDGCIFEQAILLARAPGREAHAEARAVPEEDSGAGWLVVGDAAADGVGAALASDLRALGRDCMLVQCTDGPAIFDEEEVRINPARPEDVEALLQRSRAADGAGPDAVVYLAAVDERGGDGAGDGWDARMSRTCGGALHLVQALVAQGMEPGLGIWVATRGALPVLADGRELAVGQAPLWGLGRVAARELPGLWGGLVDLDFVPEPGREAAMLRRLIEGSRSENQVALRGQDRFVARLVEAPAAAGTDAVCRDDRSYLIVGGLGAIGLEIARWMVARGARHLTLTGRRGLPPESESPAAEVVRDLEDAGARVTVEAADGADAARMAAIFAEFGAGRPALAGVVHAAAVIDFRPLDRFVLDDFLAGLRAKIAGSWNLHELTAKLDLDFFLLFSSMAAIGGFPELGHYAAGNCFLDALAHRRRQLGLPAVSVNWGLWSAGRATSDENRRLFERIGLHAMPLQTALQGLDHALGCDQPQTTFAWVDWDTFRPVYESRGAVSFLSRLNRRPVPLPSGPAEEDAATGRTSLRKRLESEDPAVAFRLLEGAVCEAVAAILGVPVDEVSGSGEGFFQMGMDSIMTVELRRQLETRLSIDLPTTLAFEYPTVRQLTEYLAGELPGFGSHAVAGSPAGGESGRDEETGDDLDSFTDDELAAELDRELAGLGDSRGHGAS